MTFTCTFHPVVFHCIMLSRNSDNDDAHFPNIGLTVLFHACNFLIKLICHAGLFFLRGWRTVLNSLLLDSFEMRNILLTKDENKFMKPEPHRCSVPHYLRTSVSKKSQLSCQCSKVIWLYLGI